MPPVLPRAGASVSRVANFYSDEEDHETGSGDEQPLVKTKRRASGVEGGKKKKAKSKGKEKEDAAAVSKREKIAAELLVKRYELPFYQGRRNILEEIMKNDTVVVSRSSDGLTIDCGRDWLWKVDTTGTATSPARHCSRPLWGSRTQRCYYATPTTALYRSRYASSRRDGRCCGCGGRLRRSL